MFWIVAASGYHELSSEMAAKKKQYDALKKELQTAQKELDEVIERDDQPDGISPTLVKTVIKAARDAGLHCSRAQAVWCLKRTNGQEGPATEMTLAQKSAKRALEVLRDPSSPAKANILSYSEERRAAGESGDELVSGWEEEAPEPDIVGMADTTLEDENDQPADAPEPEPEPEPELEPEPEPPALEEPQQEAQAGRAEEMASPVSATEVVVEPAQFKPARELLHVGTEPLLSATAIDAAAAGR